MKKVAKSSRKKQESAWEKYERKPRVVEAVQWSKHGDHPAVQRKVLVARMMVPANEICWRCRAPYKEHGLLPRHHRSILVEDVCPGNYIIKTKSQWHEGGEFLYQKDRYEFEAEYQKVTP